MSRGRVLVTRPEPGASATAARLAAMGYEPIVLPLTMTVPLAISRLPKSADAVAVSSAAALRHAPEGLLSILRSRPCYCVGSATADAAMAAGFANVIAAEGDLESLEALLTSRLREIFVLVHLVGRYRNGDLSHLAGARAAQVLVVETYDTLPAEPNWTQAAQGSEPIAVLLYSAQSAARLSDLAADKLFASWISDTRMLCLSRRIAEALPLRWRGRAEVADAKSDEAMLSMLAAQSKLAG